jgi:site-specific recombinase XerD
MSTSTTVVPPTPPLFDEARLAIAGFLTRYSGATRKSYATDLRQYFAWCAEVGLSVFSVRRAHIELCALACLLGLLGLRVSEALNINIEHLAMERGHRTVTVLGKGSKLAVIPLPPKVGRAVDLAAGERSSGPLLLGVSGDRLNRQAAARIVRRQAKRAGVTKHISPHSLRHSFITAALDAGVPLRDVQIAARHADPGRPRATTGPATTSTATPTTSSPPSSPAPL